MTRRYIRHNRRKNTPHNFWMLQLVAFVRAIRLLSHHLIASTLLIIFIASLMLPPLCLTHVLRSVSEASQQLNNNAMINVYVKPGTPLPAIDRLKQTLSETPNVSVENTILPDEGLKEFEKQTQLSNLTTVLGTNPIPAVIVLQPTLEHPNVKAINKLVADLNSFDNVDTVSVNTQWLTHTSQVLTKLHSFLVVLTLVVYLLVIIICVTLFNMLVPNLANDRPYLTMTYFGLVLGLFTGMMADYLLKFLFQNLADFIQQLAFLGTMHQSLPASVTSLMLNLAYTWLTLILAGWVMQRLRLG